MYVDVTINVVLVVSRSREAPVKGLTISNLELCDVLLSVSRVVSLNKQ